MKQVGTSPGAEWVYLPRLYRFYSCRYSRNNSSPPQQCWRTLRVDQIIHWILASPHNLIFISSMTPIRKSSSTYKSPRCARQLQDRVKVLFVVVALLWKQAHSWVVFLQTLFSSNPRLEQRWNFKREHSSSINVNKMNPLSSCITCPDLVL